MFAGSDFLLMPSRFEPCGLAQMYAQRYGSLPIAYRTGGLADTIEDGVTGFLFSSLSREGLVSAIGREQARKLLDTVKGLPSNATKRFPKKKLAEVLEIAKAKELVPMSVTTANSYMSAFVSLLDFAVAEHIIEKNPATGLRLASDGERRM